MRAARVGSAEVPAPPRPDRPCFALQKRSHQEHPGKGGFQSRREDRRVGSVGRGGCFAAKQIHLRKRTAGRRATRAAQTPASVVLLRPLLRVNKHSAGIYCLVFSSASSNLKLQPPSVFQCNCLRASDGRGSATLSTTASSWPSEQGRARGRPHGGAGGRRGPASSRWLGFSPTCHLGLRCFCNYKTSKKKLQGRESTRTDHSCLGSCAWTPRTRPGTSVPGAPFTSGLAAHSLLLVG